jgi:SRSO17 transposase
MTDEQISQWQQQWDSYVARLAPLFARSEPREQAAKYLRGLLAPLERKNGWQLAEQLGDADPQKMQRLLYGDDWDADAALELNLEFVSHEFGSDEAIGIVDETGFIKQGTRSVGVQRQYSGTMGKKGNCQVAVFLSYASAKGHVLLDRRLYLPEHGWADDEVRRKQAQVPDELEFATRQAQASAMLQHAWAKGVPMRWVTGDEIYGDTASLRTLVHDAGKLYVFAVACSTPVWRARPRTEVAYSPATGRPRKYARLASGEPNWQRADQLAASGELEWQRFSTGAGAKGERWFDWARMRVVEREDHLPARDAWLLIRRSLNRPGELAYYLSNADETVSLVELATVAATRWTIEMCFAEAKSEVGLDQYEVRLYHSWYRHITLAMIAHAWLAYTRLHSGEKKQVQT